MECNSTLTLHGKKAWQKGNLKYLKNDSIFLILQFLNFQVNKHFQKALNFMV